MSASLEIAAICLASVTSRIGFLFLVLYKSGLDSPKKKNISYKNIDFSVGERVHHNKFGDGTILSKKVMGNDVLLEIGFDINGTKKVMAGFSKMEKI